MRENSQHNIIKSSADEKKYWVALSTHSNIGARTLLKLYKRFKKLKNVWASTQLELAKAGLEANQIEAVKEVVKQKDPTKEWQKLARHNIKVIIYPDENYPKLLKEIPDPPGILYLKGEILAQDEISLGVVGSRKYTSYGKEVVEKLLWELCQNKITIVSGLALGIDTLAHKLALERGGRTIAVLGCGLDQVYPMCNLGLADKIINQNGALISEFPLGMPALRYNFPIRNRIIAGLSLGTLVAEASLNSGSLLTAAAAIDYNREVFAVPGSIFSETSEGTNKLIKMGAQITTSAADVLEVLKLDQKMPKKPGLGLIIADSREEEILLRLLKQTQSVDALIKMSHLKAAQVNSVLIEMEIKGKVINLGASQYIINGKL